MCAAALRATYSTPSFTNGAAGIRYASFPHFTSVSSALNVNVTSLYVTVAVPFETVTLISLIIPSEAAGTNSLFLYMTGVTFASSAYTGTVFPSDKA